MAKFFDDDTEIPPPPRTSAETRLTQPDPLPKASRKDRADPSLPRLDERIAAELALMLEAGLTEAQAIRELVPGVKPEAAAKAVVQWMRHPLVLAAVTTLQGGDWHKLTSQKRISLGLMKNLAQCAKFLLDNDFATVTGVSFTKMSEAREVLQKFTSGDIDSTDPLVMFMQRTAKKVMEDAVAQKVGGTAYGSDPTAEEDEALN